MYNVEPVCARLVHENKLLWLALTIKNLMQAIVLLLGLRKSLSYNLPRRNLLKSKFSSVVLFDSILNMETNIKVTRGIFAHILLESNLNYEDGE